MINRLVVEGKKTYGSLVGIEVISLDIDGQDCQESVGGGVLMCFPRPVTTRQEECPYDYLRIYDGRDEQSPVIATLCGWLVFFRCIGCMEFLFCWFCVGKHDLVSCLVLFLGSLVPLNPLPYSLPSASLHA